MKRRPFQLGQRHKRWLYLIAGTLFLSGLLWWLAGFAPESGSSGTDLARSSRPWLLKIHGGAAMAFLVMCGTLWPNHVRRAWRASQNRRSGVMLVAWLALLTVSGYGLYYFGDERVREWTAWVHDLLGLLAVAILGAHVWLGHRSGEKAANTRSPRL